MKLVYSLIIFLGLIGFAIYNQKKQENISEVKATATAYCYAELIKSGLIESTDIYEIELNKCIISAGEYSVPKILVDSYKHRDLAMSLSSSLPMDCSKGLCKELDTEGSKQKSAEVKFHLKMAQDLMKQYLSERAELKS